MTISGAEIDSVALISPFLVGLALGGFFYGGLWWTVRQLPTARRPEWLFLASFVGRTVLTVAAIYLVTGASWPKLLVCLAAFWLMRVVLTLRLKPQPVNMQRR